MIEHPTPPNPSKPSEDRSRAPRKGEERWWRDEVGIMVEHEVWHLPQLAEEQLEA